MEPSYPKRNRRIQQSRLNFGDLEKLRKEEQKKGITKMLKHKSKIDFKLVKSQKILADNKRNFEEIDFPKLLKECGILEETFKNGYCPVMQSYGQKGWLLK